MKRSSNFDKKKQLTLGAFGFKKTVIHRGQSSDIKLTKFAKIEERNVNCPHCDKKFVNNQGLLVHLECIHGNDLQKVKRTKKPKVTDHLVIEVKNVVNHLVNKVVSKEAMARGGRERAGKKRVQYTAAFKAEVINALDEEDATQESVATRFNIDQSQVSRYVKNKSQVMKDAADSYRKNL